MGAGVWRCWGQSVRKTAPDLLECAMVWEAQATTVPSISEVQCPWARGGRAQVRDVFITE